MSTIEVLEEEIASLEAILISGLTIERNEDGFPTKVVMQCSPLVASDEDRSYVGLTLKVIITPNYPDKQPIIEVK